MEFNNLGASTSIELIDFQEKTLSQEVGADY